MKSWTRAMPALLLVLAAACGEGGPAATAAPDLRRSTAGGDQRIEGSFGPGALYALFKPANWNGELITYAHGFIDPAAPVALPTNDDIEPLRDALLALGYAIAYSSYSENGLAVKDGAQRTHQLRGKFTSHFGQPERTYLMGHSLGGLVVVKLAEQHPQQYDGALAMCGMVGGSRPQTDYIANVRVLFDHFYPGVLPGSVASIPPGVDLNTGIILPTIAAIQANPLGAGAIASIAQTPVPFSNGAQLVESLVRALGFHFRGFADVLDRTHGHLPFDNRSTIYVGALPAPLLADLNARVQRYDATPDGLNYLEHFYQPTGQLSIPMLTLHNALDPVAPIFHEGLYHSAVLAAGNGDQLLQRTVARYGHCELEVSEMVDAFTDLVEWVETGVKPAS